MPTFGLDLADLEAAAKQYNSGRASSDHGGDGSTSAADQRHDAATARHHRQRQQKLDLVAELVATAAKEQ